MVWSSASTVTQAPTRCALSQMVWALSLAIFSPSRGSAWPSADSFSDTSSGRTDVLRGFVARAERIEQFQICPHRRLGVLDLGGVLTEIVDADQAAAVPQLRNGVQRVGDRLAGHEAVHNSAGDRQSLGGAPQAVRPAGRKNRRARDPVEKLDHHFVSMCG